MRSSPASQKAAMFCKELLLRQVQSGEAKLPPVRQLCASAGVSQVIMWKALKVMQEQGTVICTPGKGVYIKALIPDPAVREPEAKSPQPIERWKRVAVSLRLDILKGVYKPGTHIPSLKELAARYGVCAHTMRLAVTQAITEGYIIQERRAYTVTPVAHATGKKRVLLIAAGNDGALTMVTPRTQEHIRALEWECSAFSVQLHRLCYFDLVVNKSYAEITAVISNMINSGTLAGVLAWSVGIGDANQLAGILDQFITCGIPTALLNETTEPQNRGYDSHHGLYRVFHMGVDDEDGERVGRFLLDKSHRRVAFISISPNTETSSNLRYQGVAHAFDKCGFSSGVTRFLFNDNQELPVHMNIMNVLQGFYHAATKFIEETSPHSYLNWQIHQPNTVRLSVVKTIPKLLTQAQGIETLFTAVNPLRPLLDRVSADTGITAWVAENDIVALACCDYLKQRGIPVPGSISVIGFDDSLAASEQQLTSYNFNGRAILHTMMRFALGMIYEPQSASRIQFAASGYVAERGTTASVKSV